MVDTISHVPVKGILTKNFVLQKFICGEVRMTHFAYCYNMSVCYVKI